MGRPTVSAAALVVLSISAAVLFIGGGSRFAIGLALTGIEGEFSSGRALVGLSVALFQTVSAVALFLAGGLADRIEPGRVLLAGSLIAGGGLGSLALINAPWQLVALYGVVFALGNGIASVTTIGVLVTRNFSHRPGLANAIALGGLGLGQLVVMTVMTPVILAHGWRFVFAWLGAAHLLLVPFVLMIGQASEAAPRPSHVRAGPPPLSISEALRTRRIWLLLAVYALCGLEDFFVSTHVVAFAEDKGAGLLFAGSLLAYMGLAAFGGVLVAGAAGDRLGPGLVTMLAFLARTAVFAWVLVDQRTLSVAVFALVFGLTFLVTAPLTVVFVRDAFGDRHLGALVGLVTMVHHIFGGLGALLGARLFDRYGDYDLVLGLMLASSALGVLLSLPLLRRSPKPKPGV